MGLGRLHEYKDLIFRYAWRYGPLPWSIIYQADHRSRLELAERKKQMGLAEKARAEARNQEHHLDRTRHRNWVWEQIVNDAQWWRSELDQPCMLILSRSTTVPRILGHDAPAGGAQLGGPGVPAFGQARPAQLALTNGDPSGGGRGGGNPGGGHPGGGFLGVVLTKKKERGTSQNVRDGSYQANRRGIALCLGWQTASCNDTQAGGSYRCRSNPGMVHQCSKCLSVDHGASACPRSTGPPEHRAERGKGQGGGGGARGRGRRGAPY